MGYRVTSAFSVSPNDKHKYFLYYIPTSKFGYNWINDWLEANFYKIAENLGPIGVIIGPLPRKEEYYLDSFKNSRYTFSDSYLFEEQGVSKVSYGNEIAKVFDPNFNNSHEKRSPNETSGIDYFLHNGFPLIIFTRIPIVENIEHVDGLILNLAACKNDKNLDQLMDILIKTIKQDDLNYLIELKEILTPKEDKGLLGHSLWAKSLELNELSENILPLSLGIVNSVARLSQRRILDRTNFIEKLNNMTSQLRNYIAQNKTKNF